GGFKRKRLFRLKFIPDSDADAFGFLNPDKVICGAHIMPAARPKDLLSGGFIGGADSNHFRFVDHDMYMRYRGRGVGH
ncbi:hypothetical protein B0H14DRAFT_2248229, partial [Mycena olivaceomarginata]